MADLNKQVRTRAWVHYVAYSVSLFEPCVPLCNCYGLVSESDTSKVHLLERTTGVLAQNWSRYRTGERDVGVITLKRVEQKIPGSLDVFNVGPDRAPLWSALWSVDEQELWGVVKSMSENILLSKAFNTEGESICDYSQLESTEIYIAALSEYFETCSWGMKGLAALVAAFRLGQFRREAANYQESLGRYIKRSITNDLLTTKTISGYGLLDYFSNYVDKLIPRSEERIREIPLINRQSVIDTFYDNKSGQCKNS